jgi:hypothetical protein
MYGRASGETSALAEPPRNPARRAVAERVPAIGGRRGDAPQRESGSHSRPVAHVASAPVHGMMGP